MLNIAMSGGPCSGKTTMREVLEVEIPKIEPASHFPPEAAEIVIRKELEKEMKARERGEVYDPILPTEDYSAFQPIVLAQQLQIEAEIPEGTRLSIADRSLIDHVAYCALNGFEERIPVIERHIDAAKYDVVFFLEQVSEYEQNDIRRETPEQARATHDALALTHDESPVPTIHIPAVSVEQRLEIITDHISLALEQNRG